MSDWRERLTEKLEPVLAQEDPRPAISAYHDMPYAIFRYPPEDEFALRKELAFELERRLPEHFVPRYSMVMFHEDIPYLTAQRRGEVQKALLEEFTASADTLADVDIDAAAAAAVGRLPPIDEVRNDLSVRRS